MASQILENVYSRKDTHLFRHFCGEGDENHEHNNDNSQPLDTTEFDVKAMINQPLNDRASMVYDIGRLDNTEAVLQSTKPWQKDPNYFQKTHVSSLALLKMSVHAQSGGSIEVMGMLTGKIIKNAIVVMDAYPLPVEGTETRVNAQAEGYEFMVQYLDSLKKSGRHEHIVGWYHSHPGYGCWLSGIDVGTQSLNQQFQDPYLAIVVDPMRTITNGVVEIGAFRTYTEEYSKANVMKTNAFGSAGSMGVSSASVRQSKSSLKSKGKPAENIPEDKVKDFGMHSSRYYSLAVDVFRSEVDHMILSNLWNKFWVSSLVGGTTDEEQRVEMESFVREKLGDMEKKIDTLKKLETVKVQPTLKSIGRRSRLPGDRSPVDRQDHRDANLTDRFQQALHHQDRLSPSFLQKSQLSPFTKANLLSKLSKEKEASSDGSDSEMNDVDSDMDMRQETDDDSTKSELSSVLSTTQYTGRRQRPSRANMMNQIGSPTQIDSGAGQQPLDPMSIKRSRENEQMKATAAEASRNLMNLKLQEIIFLNE